MCCISRCSPRCPRHTPLHLCHSVRPHRLEGCLIPNQFDVGNRAYEKKWARSSLFTPQLVINGSTDGSGPDNELLQGVVSRSREQQDGKGFNIFHDTNDTELQIDAGKKGIHPHNMLRVTYEPNEQSIKVGKGANKGKRIIEASCFIHYVLPQ